MMVLILVLALLGLAVWFLDRFFHIRTRLALKGIPRVKEQIIPVLGHLPHYRHKPLHLLYKDWAAIEGGIFGVFLGKTPVVVITGEV
jgi:hypothetical protein